MPKTDKSRKIALTLLALFAFSCGLCHAASSRSSGPTKTQPEIRRVRTGPSSFYPDMPFGEAIEILRQAANPPLKIVVLWKDLGEITGIDRETPIGMDGMSGVSLRTHLNMLLTAVAADSTEKLGYVVRKGVVIIGTRPKLPIKQKTKVYDVSDVVNYPVQPFLAPMLRLGLIRPYAIMQPMRLMQIYQP